MAMILIIFIKKNVSCEWDDLRHLTKDTIINSEDIDTDLISD
jgi:hypothetical protein